MRHLLFVLLFFAYGISNGQLLDNDQLTKDTVCYKLMFSPGDTLIYQVVSYDSIIVDYGNPLLKSRTEKIQIVCDSLGYDGSFYISETLIEHKSKEAEKYFDDNSVERNDHPWVGKTVYLRLDSLGNRLREIPYQNPDVLQSPGGSFQPYLFFSFKEPCKAVGESWLVDGTDELVENANPPSILRYSALFRARQDNDTLGYHCRAFEYVKTGQGAMEAPFNNKLVKVSNVINSFGIVHISKELKKPVHYYVTIEQKLKFHLENDEEMPIQHFVTSNFTLKEIRKHE
jgi:hypothetical protein